ncbi:MAG: hypothetical protein HZC29_03665 [Thaumarchaeota archaeon]|nr:hypothetical protein [Nitrososphaerota archaeon]
MPKGITPVISIVLLLMITVVLIGAAFLFFTKVFQTSSKAGEEQTEQMTEQAAVLFKLDSIDTNNDVIYLRNTGTAPITNLTIYVNNQQTDSIYSTIQPGQTGSVQLAASMQEGTNKIKIASTGLFYLEESVIVPQRRQSTMICS